MKVRYGKPIKAKSLLGSQNISTALSPTASWQAFGYKNNGGFILGGGATEKYLNVDNTHKYFICDCFDSANITTSALILYSYSPDAESGKESTYGTAQYYGSDFACGIFSQLKHSGRANLSFRVSPTNINIDLTIKYSIVLDLTELGLDNLTAQEFYNRYKGKLGLLATGEEITLDRKVGNIQDVKSAFDGYTEVEYLESTSTQYIDTKYIPNQNTKIIFDTKMSQIPGQGVYPRQGRHGEGQRLSIYLTPSITEFAMGDYKQLSINA